MDHRDVCFRQFCAYAKCGISFYYIDNNIDYQQGIQDDLFTSNCCYGLLIHFPDFS